MSEQYRVFYRVFFGNGVPYGFSYDWVFLCMADSPEQAYRIACEDCAEEVKVFRGSVRVCSSANEKDVSYKTKI